MHLWALLVVMLFAACRSFTIVPARNTLLTRRFAGLGRHEPTKTPSIDAFAKGALLPTEGQAFAKLQFPLLFTIKVVGLNDDSFQADCVDKIAKVLSIGTDEISTTFKKTDNEKYISISLTAKYSAAAEIVQAYATLTRASDPRVKFVL